MKLIRIGKPYIVTSVDKCRCCALVNIDGLEKEVYFETDIKYKEYLCIERSDAFLSSLIILAMSNGADIQVDGMITEELYYQLINYYIPILTRYRGELKRIKINAFLTTEKLDNENKVATGESGGVDSFYSIIKHLNTECKSYKLSHVLFANIATLDNDEMRIRKWFNQREKMMRHIAKQLNLEFIPMYSNIYSFYEFPYTTFCTYFTPFYAACAMVLQKLLSVYYHSSGYMLEDFDIVHSESNAKFDVFNVKCFSSKNLVFYSSGTEVSRIEKLEYITKYDKKNVVHDFLSVCAQEVTGRGFTKESKLNCGICNKCMRTIAELYALNEVEKFESIFDLGYFKKNRGYFLAKMCCLNDKGYSKEIIQLLKKKRRIPKTYIFWKILLSPVFFLKDNNWMRHNNLVRKVYYKLGIDKVLNGYRPESLKNIKGYK